MSSSSTDRLPFAIPVYDGYFADPFVWEHAGVYYAVGTGAAKASGGNGTGRVIPVLRSYDLIRWESRGHALIRPDAKLGHSFWAPEVAVRDGRFYLYYSVGHDDRGHQLRVAASEDPEGPYEDAGVTLVDPAHCPFAIDAHPFRDDDGRWYLFYARDFLDTIYGSIYDWHTLEGPCVRKRDGHYYCFYSGGRWESESYGVDYGIADDVMGPYRHPETCERPRVLRSIPGLILGPGHNSLIVGPDGHSEFLVYHAWGPDMRARRMYIDRLRWTPDGPRSERL
jgi:beta-xylosidase